LETKKLLCDFAVLLIANGGSLFACQPSSLIANTNNVIMEEAEDRQLRGVSWR
jgi:hypothetical protein